MKTTEVTMCQSCGLPFNEEHTHFMQTEQDGSKSIYCTMCYKGGKFIEPNISIEEMIEKNCTCFKKSIGEEAARKELATLFPNLKRWK